MSAERIPAVRQNLIAGYVGSIWTGLIGVIFIPVYVRMMGIEAYGLVGFFVTLQSLFAIFDLGLSTTLNREFARLSALLHPEAQQRTMLRTVETVYWLVAALNGAIVVVLAHPIAERWIRPELLPTDLIARTVMIMGAVILLQWPLGMYSGGLLGLQKQVTLNGINAVMSTVRAVGAIVVMWFVAPTLTVFFAWQVIVSALHTAAVALTVWRSIGGTRGARFDLTVLKSVWRFAAGMVAISVTTIALTQVDKLVVSKLLSLSALGYYTIAAAAAMSIYRVITPVFATMFPRFSQLVAADETAELTSLYHRSCEALSVIVLPAAVFVAFFSREILILWTGDVFIAGETYLILTILVIGTAMNGVLHLPYAMQLAYGWTRLTLTFNVVSVFLLIPTVYVLTRAWSAVGASLGWTAYNLAGAILIPLLMHRRVLKGEQARFYLRDVGIPLAAAVLAAAILRLLITDPTALTTAELLMLLLPAAAVVQIASTAAASETRGWMRSVIQSSRI